MYALARFGLPLEQFLDLSPKELFDALRERDKHDEELILGQVKVICETIRMQTAHLMNVQGAKIRNPKKLMKFAWESGATPAQTAEQMKATMKAIAKGWVTKKSKKDAGNRTRSVSRKSDGLSRPK